jgi:uncharacterized membrane protein
MNNPEIFNEHIYLAASLQGVTIGVMITLFFSLPPPPVIRHSAGGVNKEHTYE